MKDIIKNFFRKFGYDIVKFPDRDLVRRIKIVNNLEIDVLLDVGANAGQYALSMRGLGYKHQIVSFEPMKEAFRGLETNALKDKNWTINNYALGTDNCKSKINITANSISSSILDILPAQIENSKNSKIIDQEEIEIKTLDSVFSSFCGPTNKVMLKIDTQGYEKNVLEGGIESLKKVRVIQIEISFIPLYEDQMLFIETFNYLENKGFILFSLENGFTSPTTSQLLQADAIFVHKSCI